MVVQQVDLVDVEDTAVGGGDESGFETAAAGLDGLLDVQRPHQPVLGGAHRQVDDADLSGNGGSVFSRRLAPLAQSLPVLGRAAVGAAAQDGDLGQQVGQGTDGSGLGRALLATDEHAAYTGVDGVQDQARFIALCPTMAVKGKRGSVFSGKVVPPAIGWVCGGRGNLSLRHIPACQVWRLTVASSGACSLR